jgi:hypothetical protein
MAAVTNFEKLLATYIQQIQELEQALFQLIDDRTLETSLGAQLDGLGSVVGEARLGRDDDAYRIAIKGRITLNLSNGTPEDIISVIASQIGPKQLTLTEDSFPAHFELLVLEAIDVLSGSVNSGNTENFALTDSDVLNVKIDGGVTQSIVFVATEFVDITQATANEVAKFIEANLAGGNAVVDVGRILMRSDVLGDASSIEVTGGTANVALAFDTDLHTGEEANQDLMIRVSNTMQDARGAGIRGILLWNTCAESFGFAGTPGALGFDEGCFASALDV